MEKLEKGTEKKQRNKPNKRKPSAEPGERKFGTIALAAALTQLKEEGIMVKLIVREGGGITILLPEDFTLEKMAEGKYRIVFSKKEKEEEKPT